MGRWEVLIWASSAQLPLSTDKWSQGWECHKGKWAVDSTWVIWDQVLFNKDPCPIYQTLRGRGGITKHNSHCSQ